MLDSETKRRIDNCRDILVGKVPDPKSQVEQITIALIYKFMDDMDAQAEELGGKRSFFINGFEKYGWSKLLAPEMGGQDTLNLYSEAITKMTENTHLPVLFRDIFKNAYLPYRDPETLRAFLKEINTFSYDHSERLGDAFEYLLSVLGSQGDAGQFRTPRHIIDFIVKVINPQKQESILDPACGTAGFLISAWKYILENNKTNKAGDKLKPEERAKLAANIHGYDISPDMVRLSRANMYLHGFTNPHIDEYDTLTSEDKWNEHYDVILANPPFMSPKGGIKPHKKFSIAASRSEVLFVDYIHEHLTPTGRAGIIVPEGIIFQSGTAYKTLREMLVKNSLVAVISLPAGVFQPYSGVKTSILILDKKLAKQTDKVLFVKINSDGFALGAQRKSIEQDDLPEALELLNQFFINPEKFENNALAQSVNQELISENQDWSLSGDRYSVQLEKLSVFDTVKVAQVCEINPESIDPAEVFKGQPIEYIDISSVENETGKLLGGTIISSETAPSRARRKVRDGDVLLSTVRPNLKAFTQLIKPPHNAIASTGFAVLRANPEKLLSTYLLQMIRSDHCVSQMMGMMGKGAYPSINQKDVESISFPLPSIDIQREIVAEIESYQKIINGARLVLTSYEPRIQINTEWPWLPIEDVTEINPKKSELNYTGEAIPVSFVPMSDLQENEMFFNVKDTKPLNEVFKQYTYFQENDVLLAKVTPCFENGKAGIARNLVNGIGFGSSEFYVLRANQEKVLPEWVYLSVANQTFRNHAKDRMTGTGGLQRVPRDVLAEWKIPVPETLDEQKVIIEEIKIEQSLVSSNLELIKRFEQKIKDKIDSIWSS